MSALHKEEKSTLVRAAVSSSATAKLPSKADTAANDNAGRRGAASAAGLLAPEAAVASDSVDGDFIYVGVSFARDMLQLGTVASTAENARDRGQRDAFQICE